jgi:hypothetical protein
MAFDSLNPTESLIPNDGDLVFDATTGEGGRSPAETVLPYIEQRADPDTIYRDAGVVTTPDHADFTLGSPEEFTLGSPEEFTLGSPEEFTLGSPEENDGSSQGIVIDWTPGDGSKGETVGVIAIISPAENNYGGRSVLEFSVENYPNNPGDVGHADLLFSADAPSGAGCSDFICGSNTPVLDGAAHLSLYDLIV